MLEALGGYATTAFLIGMITRRIVFVIMLYFFSCRNSGDAADLHRSACVHTYDTTHVNMCGSYYLRVEGWTYPSSPVGGHPKIIHGIPNVGTL